MRFEELSRRQQKAELCRLHSILNARFFNGELNSVYYVPPKEEWEGDSWRPPVNMIEMRIGRAGVNNRMDFNALATFYYPDEEIVFDITYLDVLIPDHEDAKQQIEDIARVMLHEMIHQYIYETEQTDNSPHGRLFKRCCKEHGLKRYTILNGDDMRETVDELTPEAKQAISDFQWQIEPTT